MIEPAQRQDRIADANAMYRMTSLLRVCALRSIEDRDGEVGEDGSEDVSATGGISRGSRSEAILRSLLKQKSL